MKSVFICGSGRCGTTILKKVLAKHPQIFSFDDEARFLDDPYGILSLFQNLTREWSIWRAEAALREFERLILKRRSPFLAPFHKFLRKFQFLRYLFTIVSPPRYMSLDIYKYSSLVRKHWERLKKDLAVIEYRGCWPGMPGFIFNANMKVSTEISEDIVVQALKRFLNNLMGEIMGLQEAKIWLDDSIFVHLYAKDLVKILPESRFIHIYRDPRDVISSYQGRLWASPHAVEGARIYKTIMDRWQEMKKGLPAHTYLEVKFEELMAAPKEGLKQICRFLDIPWHEAMLEVDLGKSNIGRWKRDLSREDLSHASPYIGNYLEILDYH